jgi:hypothetical protein
LLGHRAIDVDADVRFARDLREVHVHRAGDLLDASGELLRELVGRLVVAGRADDLHVDRRGEAEVEDLRRDVGRQEEEGRVGVGGRELGPELAHILGRRPVLRLQRDEDLSVSRRDGSALAEREVDAAVRRPEDVEHRRDLGGRDDRLDRVLDPCEALLALLDPGARWAADMELHQAGIDGREEVTPDEREEGEREANEREEGPDRDLATGEGEGEEAAVSAPHALEAALEHREEPAGDALRRLVHGARVRVRFAAEEVHHERRHERAREDVRGDHREHDGERERHEERLRRAGDEGDRQEDDADAQRRDKGGRRDLLGAVHDGAQERLPLGHVPVDVLDRHGRVVDEDADSEGHSAERHDVERLTERGEDHDRDEDRERDRDNDDERAPPAPEEEEDHEPGEPRRDHGLLHDAVDRRADEERLVEEERDLEVLRESRLDRGEHRLDTRRDLHRARVAVLEDGEEDGALPPDMDHVRLGRRAVAHTGDVAHVNGGPAHVLDREPGEVGEHLGARVERDGVLVRAHLGRTGRQDDVLIGDRDGDVAR